MKIINKLVLLICLMTFITSCSLEDNLINDEQNSEIRATGDEGDDTGGPNDKSSGLIIKDSIFNKSKATGDEGDDPGNPDD